MNRYLNRYQARQWIGTPVLLIVLWFQPAVSEAQNALPLKQQKANLSKVLQQSWQYWKKNYIQPNGAVISSELNAATSEGQSYGMLLSVYNNEPQLFAKLWRFTRTALQRKPGDPIFPPQYKNYDALFAWKWGPTANGNAGLLTRETATDGDEVIAYALLLAARKWNNADYRQEALTIVRDLREKAVQTIQGRYYLEPGADVARQSTSKMSFNPSYITPEIYQQFAVDDADHRAFWQKLTQDSYYALIQCSRQTSYGLPPRWCTVRWKDAAMATLDVHNPQKSGFNSETPRIFWHLGLAAAKGDVTARQYLRERPFLMERYQKDKKLHAKYTQTGIPVEPAWPSRLPYSALVVQTALIQPEQTWRVYQQTLGKQWRPEGFWEYGPDYYPTSVVWFNLYTAIQLLSKAPNP